MFPVVILAGGLATRLKPITATVPKALVRVAGKPFIWHQLNYLKKQGITNVVLCIGHMGELIRSEVGDGSGYGLSVRYSSDGEKLLGTGGALKQALDLIDGTFFVLYGDSFLPIDFANVQKAFLESKKLALMTVLENQNRWDRSNVVFQEKMILEYNKTTYRSEMKYIDYGLGILQKTAFEGLPEREPFDLADLYHRLSISGNLAGHEVHERFYEIGSFNGLRDANEYLSKNQL